MADHLNDDMGKALDRFTGKSGAGAGENLQGKIAEDGFPAEFETLKLSVIRPAFERIGNRLKARGHSGKAVDEVHRGDRQLDLSGSLGQPFAARTSRSATPAGTGRVSLPFAWSARPLPPR